LVLLHDFMYSSYSSYRIFFPTFCRYRHFFVGYYCILSVIDFWPLQCCLRP
jgi:hypothetical protein